MKKDDIVLTCKIRKCGDEDCRYLDGKEAGISLLVKEKGSDEIKTVYEMILVNTSEIDFEGIIHIEISRKCIHPKFFMPGYMYNRNTADKPSSGRKAFPRISRSAKGMPESAYFFTRSDRLAEPVSLVYTCDRVFGISAAPVTQMKCGGSEKKFSGFTCRLMENDGASVGYTLGYENAPWLFVQTATVWEREPITDKNAFLLPRESEYSFSVTVYDYCAVDERSVYRAIEDVYWQYHERPRKIDGMDVPKALRLLSTAIREDAWLEKDQIYSGFVYDRNGKHEYNQIPSLSWTNGLAVAVPMLLSANYLDDEKGRNQSLIFIEKVINQYFNHRSGFFYESEKDGNPTVCGWWYDGMHSGGHSSYLNGQAVYYILKAYEDEKAKRGIVHEEWIQTAGKIVARMNEVMNTDDEYPFSMSEQTGAGIEYDSLGSCWFLAATALYELLTGDRTWINQMQRSERHYYECFVKKVECYGGPLDTDKAVDSEGILGYIRAVRYLHELTGDERFLNHLKDAFNYEFTFKLGYNTMISVRPLSETGWSSCGGSITSVANPHIHPMSSTVIGEMKYYLTYRDDEYVRSRMEDTLLWSLQTFNTKDHEYGYGKIGWMSERFCFCEGLLTERYPDGELASTWFALMPWASASIIEGLILGI